MKDDSIVSRDKRADGKRGASSRVFAFLLGLAGLGLGVWLFRSRKRKRAP